MTEVAVSAESAPSIAGALSGKGEGGKIISTLGNTLIAVNQTKDISSSEVLNFLQSIHLSEKTTEALTFFATPITHQMIALADQVVSLFIELDDVKVDSKESETQKTEAQYKQHSPISEKKELPSMQFTKDLKTETKSSDSIFTLSRQVALPIKRGERSTEDGRIHNERGQERNIPKENSLTLTNQSTPKSSKDFVDYLRDQERRDQDQRGQDQREDDEPTPSHLEKDQETGTFKIRAHSKPETRKVRKVEKSPWEVSASTSKPSTQQDKQAEGIDDIYLRFMALMARILGQAEAAAQELYQRIKGRTDDVDALTLLLSKINSEKGDIDWSNDEEMKALIKKCREIGVDIPEGQYKWKEDEKKLLKENIQMRKDSMEKMTQLERTDMQRYLQEASHCHQARSNILKQIKEIAETIIRNLRPG